MSKPTKNDLNAELASAKAHRDHLLTWIITTYALQGEELDTVFVPPSIRWAADAAVREGIYRRHDSLSNTIVYARSPLAALGPKV